jgi:hypothetical protein
MNKLKNKLKLNNNTTIKWKKEVATLFGLGIDEDKKRVFIPSCGRTPCEYYNNGDVREKICTTEKGKSCIGYLLINGEEQKNE